MSSCRGIKIGDKVKITRKAATHERGWTNSWEYSMDKYVGTIGTVETIWSDGTNIQLRLHDGNGYNFPWFVLEVVK